MKSHYLSLVLCLICHQYVRPSTQFEMDSIGRVVRGHLGTLYDLRSKLGGSSASSSSSSSSSSALPSSTQKHQYQQQQQPNLKKESRGYAFHYSSADVSHPVYSSSSSLINQDFHSRMGKVSDSSLSSSNGNGNINQWKNGEKKKWDKYSKLAYKTISLPSSSSSSATIKKEDPTVNSFNIHQIKNSLHQYNDSTTMTTPVEIKTTSLPIIISPTSTSTSMPIPMPSLSMLGLGGSGSGGSSSGGGGEINLAPIKAFSQGLNSAVTTVLTQKLMSLLDQEVPTGILNPLKHLVASGNRMVEFWDKRTNARDGKSPGIVEILGYGLDQLKKFRDGQPLKTSDEVSLTTASKTLVQGMLTVKKLTNRVLGYDTDEQGATIESRGGYGHDSGYGGGGGHHASYGSSYGGLDPFSLLAALAFGAFLLQLLLTLMSTSARSLDVTDLNTPLMMSDFHMPNFMTATDKIFGTPTVRTKRDAEYGQDEDGIGDGSTFTSIVDKLDGMFKTYQQVSEKPKCLRLYLCRIAVQDAMGDENSFISRLYMFGLGHLAKDKSLSQFVKSIQSRVADGEDVNCDKIVKECVPKELQ